MPDNKSRFDQRGQKVGTQTNIAGVVQGPVFSGHFEIQGDFIYNEATKIRLPLMRPLRAQHFTGRELELTSLLDRLQPGRAVTICGPGGMGKTALASEAIWKMAPVIAPPERFPDGIIFHTFYHRPQAALALEIFARAYGEDLRPSPYEAARRALTGRQALIVLDGTEACDDLDTVLSITASCGVLITTRKHSDAPEDFSDLSPLPPEEAVQFLQAWAGTMASDEKICQSICGILGGLPLAIFLAGRYMAHKRQFGSEYLAWLEKTPLAALDMGEREHRSIPLLMKHSLEQVSNPARACLGVTGILALRPFEAGIMDIALEISTADANRSLGELVDFGLLIRPDVSYQITHALEHTYARAELPPPSDVLLRLAEYYRELIMKQTPLGLAGYVFLDAQRDHILAVQSACNKTGLWKVVRRITWAVEDYLDLRGHWTDRVAVVQAGLEAAKSDLARYDEAEFLNRLGLAYADLGEPRKAIEHYEQALMISREIGDRRGEGNNLGSLGLAYSDLGEMRLAIEYYEQALMISRKIGDRRGEGADLGNLGNAYAALGETSKAIENHEQALMISRKIGDRRGEGADLGNLGNAYVALDEPRKAIEYYEQALKICREIGDRRGESAALGSLGIAFADLGDTCKAIEYYEQALKICRKTGGRMNEGECLGNLGNAYRNLGETDNAIEYYQQALVIAKEIGDRKNEGNWLGDMGLAYADLGEPRKAIEHYEQALMISREIGDRRGEGNQLGNLGNAYADLGEPHKAIEHYDQARTIFKEIGDWRGEGNSIWNMSLVLNGLGNRAKAVKLAGEALAIYEHIKSPIAERVRLQLAEWQR